jgi:LysR family hca operon transcriptional activator
LQRGKIDIGFMRKEPKADIEYKVVAREPLVVILPSDHRLTAFSEIDPQELSGETFIGFSDTPHILRGVVNAYLERVGLNITPTHLIDNFAMGVSLVASTRGVALLPAYAENFLSWSVVSRPLRGEPPFIDLAVGYHIANSSPLLKLVLSRLDSMIEGFGKR